MDRRLAVAWLWFVVLAAIPATVVSIIAWRARAAAIVSAQSDEDARVAAAASDAKRALDADVAAARKAVSALAQRDDAVIDPAPHGADVVAFDGLGELTSPAPPPSDAKPSVECEHARDELASSNRAAARDRILAECTDLRSASGRYLWPLLAIETPTTPGLATWLRAHGDRLSDPERELLRRRAEKLAEPTRAELLAALAAPPSAWVTLSALLGARRDETADGVLRIHEGTYLSIVATMPSGRSGGVVFHPTSILRAPPPLPPDLELRRGEGAAGTNVSLGPELVLHVAPRDPAAQRTAIVRSGNVLFGIACASVLASLALAAILYGRFLGARRLAELRTDFVAAVSHELRTPVASVQMLAELLEQGAVAEDERAEVEKSLADESRRLADTLGRMLRFGALARGKLTVDAKRVALLPIATAAVERFRKAQPKRAVEVDVEDGLEGVVDAGLLGLALDNLLGNAAKYAPDGGPYQLGMKHTGSKLVISVRDRGPGLDRRAQARIFRPFERADDRLSRATEGTGIGLSLVRGIARAHDGDARVESAKGKGATFFLEIPWKPS